MLTLEACARQLAGAPNCRAFLRAWKRWRGDAPLPTAEQVRPEELRGRLPSLVVLELEASDRIVYRLVGTMHSDVAGQELQDENLVDLAPPAQRAARIERARNVTALPCGALATGRVVRPSGHAVTLRSLTMPVRTGPAGEVSRAIVAIDQVTGGPAARDEPKATVPLAYEYRYVDIGCGVPA